MPASCRQPSPSSHGPGLSSPVPVPGGGALTGQTWLPVVAPDCPWLPVAACGHEGHLQGGDTWSRRAPGSQLWAQAQETWKAAPIRSRDPGWTMEDGLSVDDTGHSESSPHGAQRWAGTLGLSTHMAGPRGVVGHWPWSASWSLGPVASGSHSPKQERERSGFYWEEGRGGRTGKWLLRSHFERSGCTEEGVGLGCQPGGGPRAGSTEGPGQGGSPECGCSPPPAAIQDRPAVQCGWTETIAV